MEPIEYSDKDTETTYAMWKGVNTIRDLTTGDCRVETFENGIFDIQFVGENKPRRGIPIHHAVVDTYGLPRYLVGPDSTVWNWSTIIRVKRVADGN